MSFFFVHQIGNKCYYEPIVDGVMMESNAAQYVHPATVDSVMWMEALENFTYFYQYFTLEDETIYSADYEDMVFDIHSIVAL